MKRNPRRTALTTLSSAMSMFVFTTIAAFSGTADRVVADTASSARIAVHNRAGLTYLLPEAYKQRIRSLPHVEAVAAQSWFGGIYHRVSDQFPNLAMDPENIDKIWPDWGIGAIAINDFKSIRVACLVGRVTMETNHWKIGQQITLRGTQYPVTVTLTIVGTLGLKGLPDLVVFRRDYLERVAGQTGQVSLLWVRVDQPHYLPQVIGAIDETFANSNYETRSEAEAPFLGSFLGSCRMIVSLTRLLCSLMLLAVALVCANTAAMSIRERRWELAVLRAIGFMPQRLAAMLIGECALGGVIAGMIGCSMASVFCHTVCLMPVLGFIGPIQISPVLIATGIAACMISGIVGGLPSTICAVSGNIAEEIRAVD